MAMTFYPSLLYWPRTLQRERTLSWDLSGSTASGGRTLSGITPTIRFDGGGFWMATMGDIQISTADHVRAWRALAAVLDGGATSFVLEARDERFAPWPLSGGVPVTDLYEAPHGDDATLDDDTEYVSNVIGAEVAEAAALRATSLTITMSNASDLVGGERFSIEHETYSHRLYTIGQVRTDSSGNNVCTIRPPLREAVSVGTRLDFDYPKCVMRLASPDAMDHALTLRHHAQATVKFVEDFPPFND